MSTTTEPGHVDCEPFGESEGLGAWRAPRRPHRADARPYMLLVAWSGWAASNVAHLVRPRSSSRVSYSWRGPKRRGGECGPPQKRRPRVRHGEHGRAHERKVRDPQRRNERACAPRVDTTAPHLVGPVPRVRVLHRHAPNRLSPLAESPGPVHPTHSRVSRGVSQPTAVRLIQIIFVACLVIVAP